MRAVALFVVLLAGVLAMPGRPLYKQGTPKRPKNYQIGSKPPPSDKHGSKPPPSDKYDSKPPPSDMYDSKPPPSDKYDSKPPPSDMYDSKPPPSDKYDSKPPPSDKYDSKPPPSDKYDSKPPPSDKYDSKPPPSDKYDSKPSPAGRAETEEPILPRANELLMHPRAGVLACGTHDLALGEHTIESPNHPSDYPNNADCQYVLTSSAGSLTFSCQAFSLEADTECYWDWLEVNSIKYCGDDGPPESITAELTIEFSSDLGVVMPGFSCKILVSDSPIPVVNDIGCGANTLDRGTTYTIKSTNHPQAYPNDEDCSYNLTTAESGDQISLACPAFNVEHSYECSLDWLSVGGQKFCGTDGPDAVTALGSMTIDFHSDFSVKVSGYRCLIDVAEPPATVAPPPPGDCSCGVPNRSSRIVGGVETEVNEYPWHAGLVSPGGTMPWCGGTIVNSMYIVTAAHCTAGKSASGIEVLIKEHLISQDDGQIRKTLQQIINHPRYYKASESGYDFALLKVATAITFPSDNTVAPACLPTAGNLFVGADAIVSGWGTTSSGGSQATTLNEVTVPIISNEDCKNSYRTINPTMICAGLAAGGKDSCQQDSGGPMVSLESDRYALAGVVSWGRGCARPGHPGVYARVTAVLPWIQSNTADGQPCA